MKVTRIYTGEDNRSHFEDLDIPLERAAYESESTLILASGVSFRENLVGDSLDFHNAPRRQFVITIAGIGEIECGDKSRRRFGAGDILLADDLTGHGHTTREIEGPRRAVFIPLPPELDVSVRRIRPSV